MTASPKCFSARGNDKEMISGAKERSKTGKLFYVSRSRQALVERRLGTSVRLLGITYFLPLRRTLASGESVSLRTCFNWSGDAMVEQIIILNCFGSEGGE